MQLLKADNSKLKRRTYNLAGISIKPKDFVESIKKLIPNFTVTYEPDFRLAIAESWPNSVDDSESRRDWGWEYNITMDEMARRTL